MAAAFSLTACKLITKCNSYMRRVGHAKALYICHYSPLFTIKYTNMNLSFTFVDHFIKVKIRPNAYKLGFIYGPCKIKIHHAKVSQNVYSLTGAFT